MSFNSARILLALFLLSGHLVHAAPHCPGGMFYTGYMRSPLPLISASSKRTNRADEDDNDNDNDNDHYHYSPYSHYNAQTFIPSRLSHVFGSSLQTQIQSIVCTLGFFLPHCSLSVQGQHNLSSCKSPH